MCAPPEDAALLVRDYDARVLQADIAGAELRVKTNPQVVAARQDLAVRWLRAGRPDAAIAGLREALRLAPSDAEAHSNLGTRVNLANADYAGGQVEPALQEFRRAISDDNADAHFDLAVIIGPRGDLDAAIREDEAALRSMPGNAAVLEHLDRLRAAVR